MPDLLRRDPGYPYAALPLPCLKIEAPVCPSRTSFILCAIATASTPAFTTSTRAITTSRPCTPVLKVFDSCAPGRVLRCLAGCTVDERSSSCPFTTQEALLE